MKPQKFFSKFLDVLIVLCLLMFFASFGFKDSITNGWYQQFFPSMNGNTITSLTFLDSLTGYATTNPGSSIYCYILKTTNGGDNWVINYTYNSGVNIHFIKIQFVNSTTGFAATNYYDFFKTTNAGQNWINYPNPPTGPDDIYAINVDTILYVNSSGFGYGVYRTTNSGLSWQGIWTNGGGSGNPNRIYMFNKNIGFSDDNSVGTRFRKTTDGGFNWTIVPNEAFSDIKLIDSLTGWRCAGDIKKTTDGGLTWVSQQLPQLFSNNMNSLSIPNIDYQWGTGGFTVINNKAYGIMYKSTNGGANWGYQLADTSIHIVRYYSINFLNNNIGWSYSTTTGVHTLVGGSDTTFFTGIKNHITAVPKDYVLFQNYPNPFNPVSSIKYQVSKSSNVKLVVYNITGKEITTLVNEKIYSGTYEVNWNASGHPSGVYFYTLFVDGMRVDTKKAILLK